MYFSKFLFILHSSTDTIGRITVGKKLKEENLTEFLDGDIGHMMENKNIWQDGEGAAMWFAGTHPAGWTDTGWSRHFWVKIRIYENKILKYNN